MFVALIGQLVDIGVCFARKCQKDYGKNSSIPRVF